MFISKDTPDIIFIITVVSSLLNNMPPTQHKKASNHHANLPLEMYSFTLQPPGKHLETTGADDLTLWLLPEC